MKFLLAAVNAKYIHSNPALYSLKACAGKEYENEIEIAEYTINNRMEDILSDLYARKPDAAAFSCYIWNWRLIREVTAELHKVMPRLPIWLGGPEVTFDAEKILRELPAVTGIMIGEGERTFSELFRYYKYRMEPGKEYGGTDAPDCGTGKEYGGTDAPDCGTGKEYGGTDEPEYGTGKECGTGLENIAGIVYRQGERLVRTGERELTDMNGLPFLYEDTDRFRNRIIYYESSRGCPFGCSYCLSSIDKRVRFRNRETVCRELQFFLDHHVEQVKFIDRTFNCNHEHTMAVWNYIHTHDNGITNFHFEIAADLINEEELTLLSQMRPGLVQLEIGVQSANPDTLREINRPAELERLKRTVARIHAGRNVHVHLDLIAGLPYEDYESFGHSFDTVYAMRPEQLQLGFLKVLKGSPMYEKAGSYGINYTSRPPYEVLYSNWMGFGEICRLKKIEEMTELYYNSGQFTHTLPVLEEVFEGSFAMFEALAGYYEKEGYFTNSPSRAYRYEVLLEFACKYDKERERLYKELLTYDIYLRENMKSRPGFAKDLTGYKERIRNFYEAGEAAGDLLAAYGEYQPRQIARMTHMDVFSYPVWEAGNGKPMQPLKEQTMVLFDYGRRSPLTNEAMAYVCGESCEKPD